MTQSFNLSQLANNVNSAGKLNAAQGLTNTVSVPNGGTGQSSFANGELLIGNSNGNTLTKAKLTAGTNVTITEGPGSITIAAAGGGGGGGGGGGDGGPVGGELGYALYTSGSGTWTCPPGVTKVKVTVIGGGGGGTTANLEGGSAGKGGTGGIAVGIYTVVPGTGYAYAVGAGGNGFQGLGNAPGANGGTSSFASFCSATGGGGGGTGPESGQGDNGIGSGGIFTNSSTNTRLLSNDINEERNIEDVGIFRGRYVRETPLSTDRPAFLSAVNWTATGIYTPGARGNEGIGGVGGVVYIEYIQVQGTVTAEGSNLDYALYTSGSGTWTCPPGVTRVKVTVIGGGSGGWGEENYGGGGGVAVGIYTVVPGTGYAYTVGAAGNGGGLGSSGTSGGTSSFASFCSATGGTIAGISNAGSDGIGSGGTFINSNTVTPYTGDLSIFRGQSARNTPPVYPSDPGVVWTSTSLFVPGARGNPGVGGVGGVVYIEYIRGVSIGGTSSIGDHALFTSGSGTWTCPPGVTKVKVTCIGGGGVAVNLFNLPFGGLAIGVYTVTPGTGYAYTVGAGGTPSVTPIGGTSSLAGLCSATGGTTTYGANVPGVGSGGTFTNSSVASLPFGGGGAGVGSIRSFVAYAIPPFAGAIANKVSGSALVWTPTSGLIPGAAGAEWSEDNQQWEPRGGVGGAILIEYIG